MRQYDEADSLEVAVSETDRTKMAVDEESDLRFLLKNDNSEKVVV